MARKTRRMRGGFPTKYHEYAHLMKHKRAIDINEFKTFLDSQSGPLKQTFIFDNAKEEYTISEWALICNANEEIYDLFANYTFDLNRRVKYPYKVLYNKKYNNSLLEAYTLRSEHIGIISAMVKQLLNENDSVIQHNVLYNWYAGGVVPTLIKCMFDMNTITTSGKNKNIIISNILLIYSDTNILTQLTHNYDYETMAKIFYYATANSCLSLMELLLYKFDPIYTVRVLFEPDIVSALIIQNDARVLNWIIAELNRIDENIVGAAICKVMKIQKQPCTREDIQDIIKTINSEHANLFFEKLGRHAIDNFAIPSLRDRPAIIVVSHGFSLGPEEKLRNFAMRRLCFFAQKGHMLCDISPYGRPIQELVCAGHYDATLECKPSNNNTIMTEDLFFEFGHSDIVQEKKDYLGFYLCYNGNVTKLNHPTDVQSSYHIEYIINYAMQVSQVLFQNAREVDLMIYSCIGYQNTSQMTSVFPKVC